MRQMSDTPLIECGIVEFNFGGFVAADGCWPTSDLKGGRMRVDGRCAPAAPDDD